MKHTLVVSTLLLLWTSGLVAGQTAVSFDKLSDNNGAPPAPLQPPPTTVSVASAPIPAPVPAFGPAPVAPPSSDVPAPVPAAVTPAANPTQPQQETPAPHDGHDCTDDDYQKIYRFFVNNQNIFDDCTSAANGVAAFPFSGMPSRDDLMKMSNTSACNVIFKGVLQVLPDECDLRTMPIRSTAELLLTFSENWLMGVAPNDFPQDDAIRQIVYERHIQLKTNNTEMTPGLKALQPDFEQKLQAALARDEVGLSAELKVVRSAYMNNLTPLLVDDGSTGVEHLTMPPDFTPRPGANADKNVSVNESSTRSVASLPHTQLNVLAALLGIVVVNALH